MSDGLRNELKITVSTEGALSGAGGASDAIPWQVSRRGQLEASPFQAVTNFAADRQLRFTNEMAQDLAQSQKAARILESSRWKSQVRYEAIELASAVRASEERIRRRDNLASATRAAQFEDVFDDDRTAARVGRRTLRAGRTAAKRIFRGWGTGILTGLASSFALPADEDGGAVGAVGRVLISTVSGGAWGGVPGAVGGLITSTIAEMLRVLNEGSKELEELRKEIKDVREELRDLVQQVELRMLRARAQAETDLEREIDDISDRTVKQYRENRFVQSGLVN